MNSTKRRVGCAGLLAVAAVSARAQTHAVRSAEPVVRAVAVYEWTGEMAKPTASRLVPVSVYINKEFEDAGIYLARPIPFALQNGNVFELERAGVDEGTLEVAFARHVETPSDAPQTLHLDDGWFAYGMVKPKPAEAPVVAAKKSGTLPVVVASGGNRPHFSKEPSDGKADDGKAADDKTATDRSGAAGAGTTVSAGAAPPVRPIDDGPTLKKGDPDSDSARDDPDRPTLKRRTPAERKDAQKKAEQASVAGAGNLNDDPDRPTLHRGKPASRLEDDDLPPLRGVPADMHQMVAVSDAKNRPQHDFARGWDSPEEKAQVLEKMRALAAEKLAVYRGSAVAPPAPVSKVPASKAPVTKIPARTAASRRTAAKPVAPVVAAGPVFDEKSEELKGYTLSYGGAATYIYSGATGDATPILVTLVAQREPDGTLKTALASVTDAQHLDRTPQMRLVDAVDPDASNRASLLFERRGATSREFALYRVIGAEAEQTIAAGGVN